MTEPASDNPEHLLQLTGLTKRYGTTTVVDDCNVDFRAGEIHAMLGANGAGKSTMVRMIAGLIPPSSGSMTLSGKEYSPSNKRDAESTGIEIVQQELNLIPTLSIAENLLLTRLPNTAGIIRGKRLHEKARMALDRFGLTELATHTKVRSLGVGQQQMVEIAAALDRKCRLLILDEPTAALSAAESETLFTWLSRLRKDGVGIVYISHRLDEVARLADRISVLRDGKHVGTLDAKDCSTDRMVQLMSGESTAGNPTRKREFESSPSLIPGSRVGLPSDATSLNRELEVTLRVKNLSGGPVKDVSFEVHRGEKLGIAGLVGSGRTELLRLVFGADIATSGGVFLRGEDNLQRFRHPSQAVTAGLAMVTEDRKDNGLLLAQSIRFNATIASMWRRFASLGIVRGTAEESAAIEQCESLEVRCQNTQQQVGTLSGGNQQKIAIAKWLVHDADVFLFDEPTRGIDVAARRRIYRLLQSLAEQGKGIVMVSSDLEELLEVCDRIAVMSDGRLVETFTRDDWSHERIMQAAFAGYRDRRTA